MSYTISPVPGSYQYKFRYGFGDDPLYIRYVAVGTDGYERRFSISKVADGEYSLVDFDDYRQKDKHYTSWERAFRGMHCICRRVFKSREVCHV